MAVDLQQLEQDATLFIKNKLLVVYAPNAIPEEMEKLASAMAAASVSAVQHIIDNAETDTSGEGII